MPLRNVELRNELENAVGDTYHHMLKVDGNGFRKWFKKSELREVIQRFARRKVTDEEYSQMVMRLELIAQQNGKQLCRTNKRYGISG